MQIDPIKKNNNKEEKSNIPILTKLRDILLASDFMIIFSTRNIIFFCIYFFGNNIRSR